MSTAFEVVPAIDLLGGRCVRLTQGRYEDVTVYDPDPVAVAARFAAHAALRRIHVVDLDGAREGRPCNTAAVRAILVAAKTVPVQLGGGIRSLAAVEEWLGLGVDRVDTVMVGDSWPNDIAGAAAAGLRTVWFNRTDLARPEDPAGVRELRALEPVAQVLDAILGDAQ